MSQHHITAIGGHSVRQATQESDVAARAPHRSAIQSPGAAPFPFLLTDEQSAACMGVSVRKFHELRSESWMPKPVVLGPRLLRWHRAELEHAVVNMPRQQSQQGEPAQLLRGKVERLKRAGVAA